jgi:hypothetical protein
VTSTADTAGHPDVTEIADLSEGLVAPDRAQELRRHLDACTACADVHASLEEIRSLLGSAPEPEGMPDDVAARIDAALAAERTADGREDGVHVSRETAAARPAADRPAPRPEAHRPAGRATGAGTGPGRTSRTPGARRRFGMLATACTAAAVVVASALLAALQDDRKSHTTAQDRPSTSADTFSEGTLQQQVARLLGPAEQTHGTTQAPHGFGASSDAGGAAGTGHPNVLKSAPTASVPACVLQGIRTPDSPLAAERGTYAGKDAYLVVLPDPSGDATRVTAFVVDATCVRQPSARATVLLSHSYPRR